MVGCMTDGRERVGKGGGEGRYDKLCKRRSGQLRADALARTRIDQQRPALPRPRLQT